MKHDNAPTTSELDEAASKYVSEIVSVAKTEATLVVIRMLDLMMYVARGNADQNINARDIEWIKGVIATDLELEIEGGQ